MDICSQCDGEVVTMTYYSDPPKYKYKCKNCESEMWLHESIIPDRIICMPKMESPEPTE